MKVLPRRHRVRAPALLVSTLTFVAVGCGSSASPARHVSPLATDSGADAAARPTTDSGVGTLATDSGSETPLPVVPPCGNDGPGGDGGVNGTYTVPVDAALAPYASFAVNGIQFCSDGASVSLAYKLPALLLGDEQHVTFSGPMSAGVAAYVLSSSQGTARCAAKSGVWSCHETFVGIAVDTQKLDATLGPLPTAEANARRQVSTTFGQDPIGVIAFRL
jgi:hypothetical protein